MGEVPTKSKDLTGLIEDWNDETGVTFVLIISIPKQ